MIAEFAAFKAQVQASPLLTQKVFDVVRIDGDGKLIRDTYVVLFGGPPDDLDDGRLSLPQLPDADATYVYTARVVSTTPGGVRSTINLVLGQIVGQVLVVDGRRIDPMRLTFSTDIIADTSVLPPLFYSDLEFTVVSRRG